MNTYISVNVVSQSLMLGRYIQNNNCSSIAEIDQIRIPVYINENVALTFAFQCEWIVKTGDYVQFTTIGKEILNRFDGRGIGFDLWRIILYNYVTICQPAWAKRIPYGRTEAYLFMSEEEQRCFEEAGLIDSYEKDVVDWWDNLASIERSKREAILDDIGRNGERLTILYEEKRTGIKPDWRSVESNIAGYDILSQRSKTSSERILIEVKSTQQSLEIADLIITRHEWETAKLSNNLHRYLFYLWDLSSSVRKLAIIGASDMGDQIPTDSEFGKWESVRIPFRTFATLFQTVSMIDAVPC